MSTLRVNLLEPYSGADVTVDADLTVTGTTTIGALSLTDLTVTGNLSVAGNTTLGDAATDTVTLTGRLASAVEFGTDNTSDIGASGANRPRTLYAGTSVVAPTVTATNVAGTLTTAAQPNVTSLGTLTALGVSGTATIGTLSVTGNTTLGDASGDTVTIVAGQTTIPLGSVSAPSLAFSGDLNTGVFSPGADIVGIATGGTERARIDASGNLGIGTASPYADSGFTSLDVRGSTGAQIQLGTASAREGEISSTATNGLTLNTINSTPVRLFTNGNERARITAGGYLKASNDGTYADSTGAFHEVRQSADNFTLYATNALSSGWTAASTVLPITFAAGAPNNTTARFIGCGDNAADRMIVFSNGDLQNTNGVYGIISDAKLKQDITDAGSQWDDLKVIRFRKYRFKSDVETKGDAAPYLLGVVAQELREVSPGLVDAHPDMESVEVIGEDGETHTEQRPTGTETLSVKQSVLLMKAAKALQEAMARIETLEAQVAGLLNA